MQPHPAPWSAERLAARLAALRTSFGPALATAYDALAERLGLAAAGAHAYFAHPLALPVIALPTWVAALAARRGLPIATDALDEIREAAVTGYLHVRLQDDLLDEGVGEPGATMLLAGALFTRHATLLGHTVPAGAPFWATFEARWAGYGEAMLRERALLRAEATYDAADFERVLDRTRPLVLPPAAVLALAGLDALLPALDRFVTLLARTHQLHTDLLDAEKDLRHGNLTWLVRRFGGCEGPRVLRQRLYLAGGFDEVVEEVRAGLTEARAVADALGLDEAAPWLAARTEHLAAAQQQVFRTFFACLLGAPDSL